MPPAHPLPTTAAASDLPAALTSLPSSWVRRVGGLLRPQPHCSAFRGPGELVLSGCWGVCQCPWVQACVWAPALSEAPGLVQVTMAQLCWTRGCVWQTLGGCTVASWALGQALQGVLAACTPLPCLPCFPAVCGGVGSSAEAGLSRGWGPLCLGTWVWLGR